MKRERRQPTRAEWAAITSPRPVVRWVLQRRPTTERSGVTERRVGPREQRRLEREGFRLEITPGGKRYWREPETGRRLSPNHAAEILEQKEVRTLEEAGWEVVEVEGKTYWRRPDSGHLYPRGAAYDVLRTMGKEG